LGLAGNAHGLRQVGQVILHQHDMCGSHSLSQRVILSALHSGRQRQQQSLRPLHAHPQRFLVKFSFTHLWILGVVVTHLGVDFLHPEAFKIDNYKVINHLNSIQRAISVGGGTGLQ
jgi:hypothetical protein